MHSRVSLTMSVEGPESRRPVLLHGEGQVVRVNSLGPQAGFAIAVECSRCIREEKRGTTCQAPASRSDYFQVNNSVSSGLGDLGN